MGRERERKGERAERVGRTSADAATSACTDAALSCHTCNSSSVRLFGSFVGCVHKLRILKFIVAVHVLLPLLPHSMSSVSPEQFLGRPRDARRLWASSETLNFLAGVSTEKK